ncbi:butyrophilin subfamily 3 member A2-like isoform X1 [Anabas testudineus]|nr:butyrophilin subfamily 3 member A2-like isoform X1 [Anabas testudineus]
MIHLKDGRFLKPQLRAFSVLVLHHAVVLLLLKHSCEGQTLTGTSQTIVTMVGDEITLPCQLEPATDAADLTVEWARRDLDPRFVYLRRDGVDLLLEQHPSYAKRTSLSTTKLKCGDVSLKLSNVELSDTGTYRCLVPKFGTESAVELTVGSVSSPEIQISKTSDGEIVLQCESKGWYPEPELLWLDAEGKNLSAGPTETVRGPDDLYTVSSRVTVEKRHSNNIICRVQQRTINQIRETQIHVADDLFMAPSSSTVRIIISLLVCLVAVLIAVLAFWKIKKTEKDQRESELPFSTMESQLLVEGGDRKHHLDMIRAKLEEEKQKAEGELKHVDHIIKTLTVQKKDLKKQREKLNSLLQDVNIKIVENKKKLEDGAFFYEEKKTEKREQTKDDLEKKNKELEEMLKNTETLLERTEGLINTMIERKGKLEKDREQITKQLKQTGRQRDEHQKKLELEQSEREEEKHELKTNESV